MSDKPRFTVNATGDRVYDYSVKFDACLYINGSFPSAAARLAYAQAVADALNKAKVPGGKG